MNPSTYLLILTILSALVAWYLSIKDGDQKDRIEDLGIISNNLTKQVEKLAQLNNQIATKNSELSQQNIDLTNKANELIEETKQLSSINKSLIEKVDLRAERYSAENALYGTLDLIFEDKVKDDDILMMHFGSVTGGNPVKWYKSKTPPSFINIEGRDLIPFRVVDDKLKVSLTVYDLSGNLVVEIVNNSWRRNPNNTGRFNYDHRGFEVIDNRGYVAISVNLVSNTEISIQGYLLDRNTGTLMVGGESKFITKPIPRTYNEMEVIYKAANIKQLFDYNSENWLGKRL